MEHPDGLPANTGVRTRARSRNTRTLGRREDVRADPRGARRREGLRVLRGSAHGERRSRRPSHPRAYDQGRRPAIPDHDGPPRSAESRLGHPRAAGGTRSRTLARDVRKTGHRALRDPEIQRRVSPQRVPIPGRMGTAVAGHRLLAGLRRPVRHVFVGLHRVGLVGSVRDREARPVVPWLSRHPDLSALRNRTLEPRGRAGLPGRERARCLHEVPPRGRPR